MLEQVLSNTEVIIQTSSERLRKAQPRRTTTTLLTEPNDNNQGARLLITDLKLLIGDSSPSGA